MRINRDTLLKIVRDTVTQRTRADRSLLSIYLCGTLLGEDYLLGGAADIDLVFVHTDNITTPREIVRITDEIHLDIAHHFHRDYRQTRALRIHPWMGPTINRCQVLFDPQHFMDFTQASVRGQFGRPDHTLERARQQVEHARQIWTSCRIDHPEPGPEDILNYLRAINHAANGLALLVGEPLTERRFLINFQARSQALKKPGLHAGLLGLLGAPRINAEQVKLWLASWQAGYQALGLSNPPVRLHPDRRLYYQLAFEALLQSEQPQNVLWPLLNTWTTIVATLGNQMDAAGAWSGALEQLGLMGAGFLERVEAMDAYLDLVEETLESWGLENGA